MKCVLRAELCYSVSVFHWAAEPKTQVWLWLQQVSDQTPACRVLHSPGTLRRCPVPTWGRIPISKISWYLRSRRSFSGGRLLPACSRRSGPSPGASSPASSLTFFCYPHSTARNRNTREQDDRMKTLAGNSPPSRAWRLHARGALLLLSGFLFFLEFCIFFYMWQATKHASKLSAGLRRLRPRLNIASPSTSRNMWTPRRCKWSTGARTSVTSHVLSRVYVFGAAGEEVWSSFSSSSSSAFSSNSCRSGLSRSFTHNDSLSVCALPATSPLHSSPPPPPPPRGPRGAVQQLRKSAQLPSEKKN